MGAYVRLHSNDYPRQVVYGGQRAGRPGQIGTQRLISQAQHEGQHRNSMKREKNTKAKGSQGHYSISDDLDVCIMHILYGCFGVLVASPNKV